MRYIIYSLNDSNSEIIVTEKGPKGSGGREEYEEFTKKLESDKPCYAVYDFDFEKEGGRRNKITFISW